MTSLLLFLSLVLLACSLLKKIAGHLGIPALLTFMVLGMLLGSDGIFKIPFDNYVFAEQISSIALIAIMFYGGFGTNWKAARPVASVSILLSSAGTILTAALTGLFCWLILGMPPLEGLLCGSILASTDAASVFSILRFHKLALKENTAPLLEVESGSNDPFAYMLTVVLLSAMEGGISPASAGILLAKQLFLGILFGFAIGFLARQALRIWNFDTVGADTIFLAAAALLGYAAPAFFGGNGFLSVYIVGIILGNSQFPQKTSMVPFFDGVTGIMQAVLFFLLGLLSFPSQMIHVLLPALGIALFLTIVARPVTVFLLMLPFGGTIKKRALVSFSGLRGAASIVFSIMTVLSSVQLENDLFHIVFVVVLFSIAIQGSLLPLVAKKLDMIDEKGNVLKTFTDYVDESPVNFIQIEVKADHSWCGKRISQLELPPGSILVNLERDNSPKVPQGNTMLKSGDVVTLCALEQGSVPNLSLTEKIVEETDLASGSSLSSLPHRPGSLIILIQRGKDYLIPDGSTILLPGDRLLINNSSK